MITSFIEIDGLSNFCRIISIKTTLEELAKAKRITNYTLNLIFIYLFFLCYNQKLLISGAKC